ncbi:MAG: hypothetical protein CVT47_01315 [Thermoplasmata archaeon HGW-Thermoplasmata-2]|nr:MAG: hypothetical protein CVT47_01315 [Thermoplasmata archaeon HGW-Thermoplasmata-2]
MAREMAWRAFAGEYKDANLEEKGEGEMAPSYVITPLGAKLNRILVVGTLMEVEKRENDVRATLWDGTDTVSLYANKYNQEAMDALLALQPKAPCYASVLARVRTFSPEEGRIFVTVKPEHIREAALEERDYWMLSAAEQTLYRIEALAEAQKMDPPNSEKLSALGYSKEMADGILKALEHYKDSDLPGYGEMVAGAIASIAGGEKEMVRAAEQMPKATAPFCEERMAKKESVPPVAPAPPMSQAQHAAPEQKSDPDEERILDVVRQMDVGKGASWEDVVAKAEADGMDKNKIEELIMRLEDRGEIEEPFLGQLKLKKR